MADNQWKGDQPATVKIVTITAGGAPAAGNTAKVTVGGQSVTYTLPATPTTISVAAALYALATSANAPPQFADVAWSYTAGTSVLGATNAAEGYPVDISVAVTGGGVTLTLGGDGDLVCTGPNDGANVLNWSLGHIPVSPERALVNGGPDILYGLATALAGCDLLEVAAEFDGGKIGLPDRTSGTTGSGYVEYRPRFAVLAPMAAITIGLGSGRGPSRCRLAPSGDGWTLNQYQTSSPSENNMAAVDFLTATTTGGINLSGGILGLNLSAAAVSEYGPLSIAGGTLLVGNGASIAGGLTMTDGTAEMNAVVGTLAIKGGTYTQTGGTVQIVQATGGTVYLDHFQSPASGKIDIQAQAVYGTNRQAPVIDCSRTPLAKTIKSGSKIKGGASLVNPFGTTVAETSVEFDPLSLAASQLGDTLAITF